MIPTDLKASFSNETYYDLHNQMLTRLPDNLQKMRDIEVLNIAVNPLEEIPEWIAQLPKLTTLIVSPEQLEVLPEALQNGLIEIQVLEPQTGKLDLSHQNLTEVPSWAFAEDGIVELDLSHNKIQNLPETFSQLTQLKKLKLGNNIFRDIPEVLGALINLEELDIQENPNTDIPESLDLESLRLLTISDDQRTILPLWVNQRHFEETLQIQVFYPGSLDVEFYA